MRAPSQIAADVLLKLAEEDEWSVPEMGTLGGGLGLSAGLAGAGLKSKGNIEDLLRLHYQRPQLESSREDLDELLAGIKEKNPAVNKMRPRQLTRFLLENKDKIPPEVYYAARRGHEEGLSGLSRNQKLTQLLKKRLIRTGGIGAGLGLGAGVSAGLLAAIGSGKFDDSES